MLSYIEIVAIILSDEAALDRLPQSMRERAEWARYAIQHPDEYVIEFGRYGGEGYIFAAYHPEHGRWYDVDGHYHGKGPAEVIATRESRRKQRQSRSAIKKKLTKEVHKALGVADKPGLSFSQAFYQARKHLPRICTHCQSHEADKKFHWHHLDTSLLHETDAPSQALDEVDFMVRPERWQDAYTQFLLALKRYWTVPLDQTILLCPSCHRKAHPRGGNNESSPS